MAISKFKVSYKPMRVRKFLQLFITTKASPWHFVWLLYSFQNHSLQFPDPHYLSVLIKQTFTTDLMHFWPHLLILNSIEKLLAHRSTLSINVNWKAGRKLTRVLSEEDNAFHSKNLGANSTFQSLSCLDLNCYCATDRMSTSAQYDRSTSEHEEEKKVMMF